MQHSDADPHHLADRRIGPAWPGLGGIRQKQHPRVSQFTRIRLLYEIIWSSSSRFFGGNVTRYGFTKMPGSRPEAA